MCMSLFKVFFSRTKVLPVICELAFPGHTHCFFMFTHLLFSFLLQALVYDSQGSARIEDGPKRVSVMLLGQLKKRNVFWGTSLKI